MPKITGQNIDPDANGSIADSLRAIGEGSFRPIDPLTRERMAAEQRHSASRAKAADALSRGDTREYIAQSIMADQSADDAVKYAGAAGYNIIPTREGNRNVGTDGYPVPRYVPSSAPAAPTTYVQPAASAPPTPAINTAPQAAPAPTAPAAAQPAPLVSTFTPLAPAAPPPVPRVNFFPGLNSPRAPRPFGQTQSVSPF
jgi:hypothetical protein